MNFKLMMSIMKTTAKYHCYDDVIWRFDGDDIHFFISCSDLFYWATGDEVEITSDNITLYEKAMEDCVAKGKRYWGTSLFCCKSRMMRPQGAYYAYISPEVAPLFDECGPDRDSEVGFGCTKKRLYKTYAERAKTHPDEATANSIALDQILEIASASVSRHSGDVSGLRGFVKKLRRAFK